VGIFKVHICYFGIKTGLRLEVRVGSSLVDAEVEGWVVGVVETGLHLW